MSSFSIYLNKLKKLEEKNSIFEKYKDSKKVVLILSGSGNYNSSALSKEQRDLLNIFKDFSYDIIETNFPYNIDFPHEDYIDVNILKASFKTIVYYLHTLFNKNFQIEIKRNLKKILEIEEVVVITQSSGLNILNRFIDFYDEEILKKVNIKVFALGPVGKKSNKLKNLDVTVIKGKYDEYSRLLDFHKIDRWIKCRHLTYLKNEELKSILYEYLGNR